MSEPRLPPWGDGRGESLRIPPGLFLGGRRCDAHGGTASMIGSAPRGTRASQGRAVGAQRLALTGVRLRGTAHREAESRRARLRKQPGSEGGQRGERCRGRAEVRPLCRAHFKTRVGGPERRDGATVGTLARGGRQGRIWALAHKGGQCQGRRGDAEKAALAAKARSACEASEASEPRRAGSLLFLYLIIGTLLRQLSCPLLMRAIRFTPTVRWRKL